MAKVDTPRACKPIRPVPPYHYPMNLEILDCDSCGSPFIAEVTLIDEDPTEEAAEILMCRTCAPTHCPLIE